LRAEEQAAREGDCRHEVQRRSVAFVERAGDRRPSESEDERPRSTERSRDDSEIARRRKLPVPLAEDTP
jgi:hypothetical protein